MLFSHPSNPIPLTLSLPPTHQPTSAPERGVKSIMPGVSHGYRVAVSLVAVLM